MDKIQAAIAKARAARQQITGANPDKTPSKERGRATLANRAAAEEKTVPQPPFDRAAVWQPLATFMPPAKRMARHRIVTFDGGSQKTPEAIAFDMLRTKVLQQMRSNGWKRLAITSPGPSCGKTTIALNLAFSLARQPEIHTIVAEMDMLRPSMAKTLGVSGSSGFSDVIDGTADFADVARRARPNLAFALNYGRTGNSSELLQSSTIGPLLANIEDRYKPDLTIFDMPPMLHSDDMMAFVEQVDCVLLIAGAESTSLGGIDICERDLAAQTNVMGVLLNKCRYLDKDSGGISANY